MSGGGDIIISTASMPLISWSRFMTPPPIKIDHDYPPPPQSKGWRYNFFSSSATQPLFHIDSRNQAQFCLPKKTYFLGF